MSYTDNSFTAYVLVKQAFQDGADHERYVSNVEWGDGCWGSTPDLREAKMFTAGSVQRAQKFVNAEVDCGELPESKRWRVRRVHVTLGTMVER